MKRTPANTFKSMLAVALLGIGLHGAWPDSAFTVTVFDVGQGDAVLVQCGTRQVLIDGGPDGLVLARLGRTMPFFDHHLDAIVLTHPHADHYLGLIPVMARYRVDTVLTSGLDAEGAEYQVFIDAVATAGASLVPIAVGDRIAVGHCGALDVIWSDADPGSGNPNDASVVMRASAIDAAPNAVVLLTGDATEKVEQAMLESEYRDLLRADGLKAGHHGSKTSSSAEFLEAVRPVYAAVSSGLKNSYGHPAPSALQRLREIGAQVLRTDLDGDIRFVLTQAGISATASGK